MRTRRGFAAKVEAAVVLPREAAAVVLPGGAVLLLEPEDRRGRSLGEVFGDDLVCEEETDLPTFIAFGLSCLDFTSVPCGLD